MVHYVVLHLRRNTISVECVDVVGTKDGFLGTACPCDDVMSHVILLKGLSICVPAYYAPVKPIVHGSVLVGLLVCVKGSDNSAC